MIMTWDHAEDFLLRDGDLRVPCSRYGSSTSDCAWVAYVVARILDRDAGTDPDDAGEELLDYAMGLVVNDHDDVAYTIANYATDVELSYLRGEDWLADALRDRWIEANAGTIAAYVACALWSSTDTLSDDSGEDTSDHVVSLDGYELGAGVEDELVKDLFEFMTDPDLAEDLEGLDPEQVAHDFWLTRNRHGVGFWDRGLGERGERLTAACRPYGAVDLYLGDDGLVYVF